LTVLLKEMAMRGSAKHRDAIGALGDRTSETVAAEKPPVFIVGAQRSGTTVLRLMLNSHPGLAIAFETNFLPVLDRADTYGDLSEEANRRRLLDDFAEEGRMKEAGLVRDREAILAHHVCDFRGFLEAVFVEYAKLNAKRRWGVKCPGWVTCLDRLWDLFPGCQIIHIVRDGRDVALSLSRVSWGLNHIPRAAEDWRWKVTLGRRMGAMIADHYCEVRYEDLVLNPEDSLRAICYFLSEPFEPRMLEYHHEAGKEMPDRSLRWHQTSVSPLDTSKVYEWKRLMSKTDRIIFDQVAGEALELFGYEHERAQPTLASRAKWLYYTLWKRW
jgi:hypothetical protein